MLAWKDAYCIGIDTIDEQHKMFFEIGDRAYKLLKDEFVHDKYDKIVAIIHELADYADYHFQWEEKYMKEIGYNEVFHQVVAHAKFMEKARDVDLNSVDDNQEAYLEGIIDFVLDWITNHIFKFDIGIAKFVLGKK